MGVLRERASAVVRAILVTARSSQLSFLAAGLAYFLVLSLVPLGLLAFIGAALVGGDAFAAQVIEGVESVLSPEAAALLATAVRSEVGLGGVTLASTLVLAWSGLRVFRGLAIAFATVYGEPPGTLRGQVRDGLVALGAVGVAVVAVTAASTYVTAAALPLANAVGVLALLLALTVVFLPLYYVLPTTALTVREALPGAVVAAVGWTVLGATFAAYAAVATGSAVFAVLGGVVLLLAWCYVASLVVLAGATVNAALAGERPDRHIQGTADRTSNTMGTEGDSGDDVPPGSESDVARIRDEIDELRADVEAKSTPRDELERDLRRYVRRRVRRGHARGWGPYLVLAYGTAMTLGAFSFLSGGWAILAMIVVWLSTLGLYVLMVIVGVSVGVLGVPGRIRDALGRLR